MGKGPLGGLFKGFDGFGKTMDDVKVKTRTGGLLTMISAALIVTFTIIEFIDYRKVQLDTSVLVDRSRGERLTIAFDITFPRVPCYLVSVDVTDITGEQRTDLHHETTKVRLGTDGMPIQDAAPISELKSEVDMTASTRGAGYCGSCYGGVEPETGCCNTCEDVRQAYINRGWSFASPESIDQCVAEHWMDKIHEQSSEGCRVKGRLKVNKVVGNLHFSPGRSFQSGMRIDELVPYLNDGGVTHHWGHTVNSFAFESAEEEYKQPQKEEMAKKLGMVVQPLDYHFAHARNNHFMFQYFLKVVGTRYHFLDERFIQTHQYSVTTYERDLAVGGAAARNAEGLLASHGMTGQSGAFFNYEISPMVVVHHETRQSFAHFLTSLCAIIGGVLTIATLVDSALFSATSALKSGPGASSNGYTGKLM